jgi:hypothetical protein
LKDACVQGRRVAFCHFEKTVTFEFFPGIIFGGDCPLGCIAVAGCYCSSRVGRSSGDVFVARILSVWAQNPLVFPTFSDFIYFLSSLEIYNICSEKNRFRKFRSGKAICVEKMYG